MRKIGAFAVLAAASVLMGGGAHAAFNFTTGGTCTGCTGSPTASSDNSWSTTGTATGTTSPIITVSATGWANTAGSYVQGSASGGIQQAYVPRYGGGFGLKNDDAYSTGSDKDLEEGVSPEHAIDNDGRFDMVMLNFGSSKIQLESVTLGWTQYDADISVLAFVGSGSPDLSTVTSWGSLGAGWQVIGNYDANAPGGNNGSDTDVTVAVNSGNVAASYWLIGAFNPIFGTSATNGGTVDNGISSTTSSTWVCTKWKNGSCNGGYWKDVTTTTNNNDYIKLAAVSGSLYVPPPPPPGGSAPEPGSLALAGLALAGLLGVRRFKRN